MIGAIVPADFGRPTSPIAGVPNDLFAPECALARCAMPETQITLNRSPSPRPWSARARLPTYFYTYLRHVSTTMLLSICHLPLVPSHLHFVSPITNPYHLWPTAINQSR